MFFFTATAAVATAVAKKRAIGKKDCAIFDTYAWKVGGFLTVSGPQECPKSERG